MHVTGAERTVTVSQEAIRYAAMYADPNLELFEQEKIPTTTKDTKLTDHLYRYVNFAEVGGFGKATDDEKDELAKKLVDTGFFSKMEPVDIQVKKHEVNNYIIYQTYEVEYQWPMGIGCLYCFYEGYISHDYAEVVTNHVLLTNAGMILREAWEQVAYS